ncbi:hypothetical protein B0H14DRAFT_2799440, partial [Mycena olivaceomarginata]
MAAQSVYALCPSASRLHTSSAIAWSSGALLLLLTITSRAQTGTPPLRRDVDVCLRRAVPSARRLCPAARTPPKTAPQLSMWGTLSALRRTHPRAPVCDVTCAGRGGPPTPTTTSARDASRSHSPPQTRADHPPLRLCTP